jgi:fumarate hydratase class II
MGEIQVPTDRLWGAQTQRSLHYFSIGTDLIPPELIPAFAYIKKAAAIVNHQDGKLPADKMKLIVRACGEILEGKYREEFPLFVWMTGSGTQFNMNINEVISNLCSLYAGSPLGSKKPVHPNDDVNMSQSSNDVFPAAMYIASVIGTKKHLMPAVTDLKKALHHKAEEWKDLVKIGRTHLQDATTLTLGQEISGYVGMLAEDLDWLEDSLQDCYNLALGGTAVGTGINAQANFGTDTAKEIAKFTGLPFVTAPNKFTVQGSHDALVQLSGTLKTLAVSLYKIANDIRLLASGPRSGFNELTLPANEPGSYIMPGKINPTQCEAMTMVAAQVIANDQAVSWGGAGGILDMNVYKPLMIYNIMNSIRTLTDCIHNFRCFCIEGMQANEEEIGLHVHRSLMHVTALNPVIGYDNAARIAHHAFKTRKTLKESAMELKLISEADFDRLIPPVNN